MFAESLLEVSWAQRTRRNWTTLTSFGVQAAAIGLLLLLPLWETVGLPKTRSVSTPVTLGRAWSEPAPSSGAAHGSSAQITSTAPRFVAPGHIPTRIVPGDDASSIPLRGIGSGLDRIGDVGPNALLLPIISGNYPVVLPVAPTVSVRPFRSSSLLEGRLIRRVQPAYPYAAKMAHIQGPVVLAAIISKEGMIDNLQLVSGHPMLVGAAIDAVRQWRYRPYVLNGETIEVETQITVNFILSGD